MSGPPALLQPWRVLDLTDHRGQLCGLLLASLGADVILVEPPSGTDSRSMRPHLPPATDRVESGEGLWHWALNRGKRSVVTDLTTPGGRDELLAMVANADVVIESFTPGVMEQLGINHDVLAGLNPRLVHTSITPFGSRGPKARWAATDLTVAAASGVLVLSGNEDRPPVRISVPQAFGHACLEALSGTLIALHERALSGLGQHVDVSAQEAFAAATQGGPVAALAGHPTPQRTGSGLRMGEYVFRNVYRCADGHASVLFQLGAGYATANRALLEWALESGFGEPSMLDEDWATLRERMSRGTSDVAPLLRVFATLERFVATLSKRDLMDAAMTRRVLVAQFSTTDDVLASQQLAARDYWESLQIGGRVVRVPRAWVSSNRCAIRDLGAAPTLDAHGAELRAERPPIDEPQPATTGRASAPRDEEAAPPLAGLRVLDLSWVIAGPSATRVLADAGATVVSIESAARPDPVRAVSPFKDGVPGMHRSVQTQAMQAGKLGLALDLNHPDAHAVVLDLVRWCDVVVESFSPGALARLGFDYDSLRDVNPGLIMASSSLMGQSGPLSGLAGYGTMASAISGFGELVGWPDRDPVGPFGAYTDYVSPRFTVAAILAALDHRRRTGNGQYLDLAQVDSSLMMLLPALIETQSNSTRWTRDGDGDRNMWPHGVYPAAGDDEWVAIACRDDDDRSALATAVDSADLTYLMNCDPESEALREAISAWTCTRERDEITATLQAVGVPAHGLQRSLDTVIDEHLSDRGYVCAVPTTSFVDDTVWLEGPRVRLSRTPLSLDRGAPQLGEHSTHVLVDLVGYSAAQVEALYEHGALR